MKYIRVKEYYAGSPRPRMECPDSQILQPVMASLRIVALCSLSGGTPAQLAGEMWYCSLRRHLTVLATIAILPIWPIDAPRGGLIAPEGLKCTAVLVGRRFRLP